MEADRVSGSSRWVSFGMSCGQRSNQLFKGNVLQETTDWGCRRPIGNEPTKMLSVFHRQIEVNRGEHQYSTTEHCCPSLNTYSQVFSTPNGYFSVSHKGGSVEFDCHATNDDAHTKFYADSAPEV